MSEITSGRRWFRLTPGWLVLGLLAVEGFLFLSQRFRWFSFNTHKGWTVLIDLASVGAAMLLMLLWLLASLAFRRRFQFSLRSLLALTVAVALACSWLAVELKKAREQKVAAEAIRKLGGAVTYDYEVNSGPSAAEPEGPVWLRKLLKDDFFNDVVFVYACIYDMDSNDFDEAGLAQLDDAALTHLLEALPQLQTLDLLKTQVTDAGLVHLKGLTQLQSLDLSETQVTDAGLVHLERLTQLQMLALSETQVTDAGLVHLEGLIELQSLFLRQAHVADAALVHIKGLTRLHLLDLGKTQVTDAGLEHLKGLGELKILWLDGTHVTLEVVMDLHEALPKCQIAH